jgi:hypothetical protein
MSADWVEQIPTGTATGTAIKRAAWFAPSLMRRTKALFLPALSGFTIPSTCCAALGRAQQPAHPALNNDFPKFAHRKLVGTDLDCWKDLPGIVLPGQYRTDFPMQPIQFELDWFALQKQRAWQRRRPITNCR